MSNLMLDVDQAGELKAAFRRGDWTNTEIKTLSEGDFLKRVREVILGLAEIKPIDHLINFDSAVFCPPGLTVASGSDQIASRVRGVRKLEDLKVQTHLDVGQKGGSQGVKGYDLKQKLEGKNVLGAQILDFYLEHLNLIPEDWKTKGWIFFWGTLYCAGDGRLYVRYLRWDRTSWISVYRRLDNVWYDDDPAAVSVSTQS